MIGFVSMAFVLMAEAHWAKTPESAWIPRKVIHWQAWMVSLPACDISESERATTEQVQVVTPLLGQVLGGRIF